MPPKKSDAGAKKAAGATHSYHDMIKDAIINLKERSGSSRPTLKKYVKNNNTINANDKMFDSLFNRALRAGVEKGEFAQPKGPSGPTKLAKKEAKPAAEKKPAVKKAAPKKAAVTANEKKPVTKKPAAKKAAAPKKPAAKKAAPKKAAAATKKPAAKKAAPKKAAAAPAVEKKEPVLGKTKSGRVTKTTAKTPVAKKVAAKKVTKKAAAKA